MCHLILFLPVLALPVFWLLPLPVAGFVYGITLLLSMTMYYMIFKVMHQPNQLGVDTLLNRKGRVLRSEGGQHVIRLGNELWTARCNESLEPNDEVAVVGLTGLTLQVQRLQPVNSDVPGIAAKSATCRRFPALCRRQKH